MKRIIVVPGFGQTHLRDTASMLEKKNLLKSVILPFNIQLSKTSKLRKIKILDRAANRNYGISKKFRQNLYVGDLIYQAGLFIHKTMNSRLGVYIESMGFKVYSYSASRKIEKISSVSPLLVRAGFGGRIRKMNSNPIICDVSLVHPAHMKSLVETGQFPIKSMERFSAVENLIIDDISDCQFILANSDFVLKSLQMMGIPESKIVVAYLEPENVFRNCADKIMLNPRKSSNYLLFAGTLELRKGIFELLELAKYLEKNFPGIELHLVGNWFPSGYDFRSDFYSQANVRIFSWMSREELAQKIYDALIFVFPSRAEGSARVITEAMYLGVPVVTTINSGSPVIDLVSGRTVESNDSEAFNKVVASLILDRYSRELFGQRGRSQILDMIAREEYFKRFMGIFSG